ncbi:MAG: tetratricopeptide repeat protein [bacterium]
MKPSTEVKIYDTIIEWGIYLNAFLIPLLFTTQNQSILMIKTVVNHAIVYGLVGIWFLKGIVERRFVLKPTPLNIPLLVFWWIGIISGAFFSEQPWASVEELGLFTSYILYFFLIVNHIQTLTQMKRLLWAILIPAVMTTLYGIIQAYYPTLDPVEWGVTVFISTFGNKNFFAGYLVMLMPVVASLILMGRSIESKVLAAVLFILMLLCVLYSQTRGVWLGAIAAFLCFAGLSLKLGLLTHYLRKRFVQIGLVVVLVGVTTLPPLLAPNYVARMKDTFKSIFQTQTGTNVVRIIMWRGVLSAFKEHPIIGHGIGTFQLIFPAHRPSEYHHRSVSHNTLHAHNEYLEYLAEEGILGFLSFLVIMGAYFYGAFGLFKLTSSEGAASLNPKSETRNSIISPWVILQIGLISALVGAWTDNLTGVNLRWIPTAVYTWLMMGVTIANRLACERELSEAQISANQKRKKRQTVKKAESLLAPANPFFKWGIVVLMLIAYIGLNRVMWKAFLSDRELKKGIDMISINRWPEAIQFLNKSLELNPYNLSSYYKIGHAYAMSGENDKAMETYRTLSKLAPNYSQIHYNFGVVYGKKQLYDEAIGEFKQAIKIDRYCMDAYYNLAHVYAAKGQMDEAIKVYEDALSVQPMTDNFEYPSKEDYAKMYYTLGLIRGQKQEYDTAALYLNNALGFVPDYKDTNYKLALIYRQKGDFPKAKIQADSAIAQDPNNAQARTLMASLYETERNFMKALAEWREVLRLDKNNSLAQRRVSELEAFFKIPSAVTVDRSQ